MESVDTPVGQRGPSSRRGWTLLLGPTLAAVVLALSPGDDPRVARMAATAAWMAAWWISEAVPVAVTSLLPLVLLPFAGILPMPDVAENYGRPTIFLFLGGFLLALGLQVSGAHRRLALSIVAAVGSRPRRLVLGFMLACWLLSMWIANTSTAMLMLPVALSVLRETEEEGLDPALRGRLAAALLLGIAYACNIGGMATPVGTPPNLAFLRIFHQGFPDAPVPSFLEWTLFALPFTAVFLMCGWWLLARVLFRLPDTDLLGGHAAVAQLRAALGPLRRDERLAGALFAVTALLWMTGASLDAGGLHVPGWRELLGVEAWVHDATVAVAMAVLLFALPSADRPGERLLEWNMTAAVPWGLLLLFGGGFALADGFGASGLSVWAGSQFAGLSGAPPLLVILAVCTLLTFLTELTSNLATTEMVLPILAAAAVTLDVDPRLLMVPATLSASCAFMMPVATPPNAIVFGSGLVPIRQMIRAGLGFNLLGVVLITAVCWGLGGPLLGIDLAGAPTWARP